MQVSGGGRRQMCRGVFKHRAVFSFDGCAAGLTTEIVVASKNTCGSWRVTYATHAGLC